LFFIGVASASFYDAVLEKEAYGVLEDFMVGMDQAPSLSEAVDEDSEAINQVEDDIKTQIGNALKSTLDKLISQIKERVEHGKTVAESLLNKAKEVTEELKKLGLEVSEEAKTKLAGLREKAKDLFQKFIDQILGRNKETRALKDLFNFRSILESVKDKIKESVQFDKITEYIQKLFGNASLMAKNFIDTLKAKGTESLKNLIDKILTTIGGTREARDIKDFFGSIRDFFKGIGLNIAEKFQQFGGWVKEMWSKGTDHAKDRVGRLREIATEMIGHTKEMSKEVAKQALQYFNENKADLGEFLFNKLKDALMTKILS